jgi:predicted acylesterase/phospholipase RssA
VSSDLTAAAAVIHEHGLLRHAVTASSSLPGIARPVLDNLPATVLREVGCSVVIAAKVTVEEDGIFAVDHVPGIWEALRARRARGRPPVNDYRLMDFNALDELHRIGVEHASDRIREWSADPTLSTPVGACAGRRRR